MLSIGLQCFLINPDGTTSEVKSPGPLKEILKTDESYVIVSDEARKVYLWKGIQSSVRSKFIGAKRSQEIRGQVGMNFAVVPLDQGEEDNEFIKLIGGKTEAGAAKEIKVEQPVVSVTSVPTPASPVSAKSAPKSSPSPVSAKSSTSSVHPLREKDTFGAPRPAEGMSISGAKERYAENTGPLYTGQETTVAIQQEETQINFNQIMAKLEEIKIPPGFERELIIIGNQAYCMVEKVQTFLGKKQVEKVMERLGSIPEGVFFAQDYSPRLLSENGKVLAIEFLKRMGTAEFKADEYKSKKDYLKDQIKIQLSGKK